MLHATDEQLTSNLHTDIFAIKEQYHFHQTAIESIFEWKDMLSLLSQTQFNSLLVNYRNNFLEYFRQANQYMYFSKQSMQDIDDIYLALLREVANGNLTVKELEIRHHNRIESFLDASNPASCHISHNGNSMVQHFVCAEYSSAFIVELLDIDFTVLKEPILDIGCGCNANLVGFLRQKKMEVYGIDRNTSDGSCYNIDWFDFDFGINRWGSIISNLSFSSHFLYHHLHADEIANQYAHTYMQILASLKPGGIWTYAPAIEFFERLLPSSQYSIKRTKIDDHFSRTMIILDSEKFVNLRSS